LTRWIPVVLWAACISWFSTGAFSAQSTNAYIDPVLRRFLGELSPEAFRLAHAVIRKSAHLIEYAVLGMLMARALTLSDAPVTSAVIVRTIVYCALYASADELHQVFVPSRTGSPYDVLIDTLGTTAGTLLFAWRRGTPPRVTPPRSLRSRWASHLRT
jgi:VanZ family protein